MLLLFVCACVCVCVFWGVQDVVKGADECLMWALGGRVALRLTPGREEPREGLTSSVLDSILMFSCVGRKCTVSTELHLQRQQSENTSDLLFWWDDDSALNGNSIYILHSFENSLMCSGNSSHVRFDWFIWISALPIGSMYFYRKVGGSVAFSWMAKWDCVWRWDIRDIIVRFDYFWFYHYISP